MTTRRSLHAAAGLPLAATWSLVYLALGITWLAGADGNPTDPHVDPAYQLSLLGSLGPGTGAAVLTGLAGAGGVLATVMVLRRSRRRQAGTVDRLLGVLAVVLGLVLAVVLPDFRLLAALGYLPSVGIMALFGALPEGTSVLTWPLLNMALLTAGGLAWVAAGAAYRSAANRLDPGYRRPSWTAPSAAARWGAWATGIAMAVPIGYAITRYAWALGIPLGVTQDLLHELGPSVAAGAMLATLGIGGAVLTWGLTRPWGEVFPRWMPVIGRRRVPVPIAVVPASIVAAAVASAGLMFWRFHLAGEFGTYFPGTEADVAAWLPELFWPLWGAALAAATYAYVLRRRGTADRSRNPTPRFRGADLVDHGRGEVPTGGHERSPRVAR